MPQIYADYNATAPLRAEAYEAMRPWLTEEFGNPSSTHQAGQRARAAIESAREAIAKRIHCKPSEIIFTSGGTEAINLALRGSAAAHFRLQTARTEHHATLRAAEAVAGAHLEFLESDTFGNVIEHPPKGGMVSLMHVNNETGVIHPIAELSKLAHAHGAVFHCDAVQSLGKIQVDVERLGVDFLSASAHKFGGPKGVGFLYVRSGQKLNSQVSGGEQEGGHRGGTQNVAGIVGMAKALDSAMAEMPGESARQLKLRDALHVALRLPVNGGGAERVYNTHSVLLPGIESDMMIMKLDQEGIMVSAGSACAAGAVEPSHVLRAMGVPENEAKCVIRFSLGRGTKDEDIPLLAAALTGAIASFKKAGL